MGRTASHARGVPPPLVIDRIRPAPVVDLEAHSLDTRSVAGSFHVSGDDSLSGSMAGYEMRRAAFPLDEQNFNTGILAFRSTTGLPAGTFVQFSDGGLPEGSRWWYALRVFDDAGNSSAVSNSDSVSLPGLPPAGITDLRVIGVTSAQVGLTWTAPGDNGLAGRPLAYQISGSTAPLDSANVDAAPRQVRRQALKDAGEAESTFVAVTPGRRWRFAVRGEDQAHTLGPISNVVEFVTPVGGALGGHTGMGVAARPQPAATSVIVDWQGDESGTVPQWLEVYDINGRLRHRIALGTEPGGSYNWDGRDGESRLLPAGLYFIRLVSGARHAGSRVVFVR
jgi:hypothetical protein